MQSNIQQYYPSFYTFYESHFFPGQTPVPPRSGTCIPDLSHDPIWAIWLAEVRKFHQHHDRMWHIAWWRHQIETFRVTGHLCGESTGHWWSPLTKASDAVLWCFLWSAPQIFEQTIETPAIWDAHYDVTVMEPGLLKFFSHLWHCSQLRLCCTFAHHPMQFMFKLWVIIL